jgi:hypothetical protein
VQQYTPVKVVWTEADFHEMSWHDCRLHAVAIFDDFNPHLHDLRLDIDYIFEWVDFDKPSEQLGYWVSPATLVFDPQRFHLDVPGPCGDWIERIERTVKGSATYWRLSLNTGGDITVIAAGFRQYIRRPPVFIRDQSLETHQRGGISFELTYNET